MYKAKMNFLWFKKGDEISDKEIKENPNWTEEGRIIKISEKEIKEAEKATLKAVKEAKDLKAKQEKEEALKAEEAKKVEETKKVEEEKKAKESLKSESSKYFKDLHTIQGVGGKTAKDIVKVFPTREKLEEAISAKKDLPFRDDVVSLLVKNFN